jgi:hypothetical protein
MKYPERVQFQFDSQGVDWRHLPLLPRQIHDCRETMALETTPMLTYSDRETAARGGTRRWVSYEGEPMKSAWTVLSANND